MMAKYLLRYFFEPGAAVCLWAANHAARTTFGYPIAAEQLNLAENTRRRLTHLCRWFDTSVDWAAPANPSPWTAAEKQRFGGAAQRLLAAVGKELGADFEVLDESQTLLQAQATVTLRNPRQADGAAVSVAASTGFAAVHLCIPPALQVQLGLEEVARKDVALGDGSWQRLPYVGPVELRFKDRVAFVGAAVLGDEVLLGAIPMEDLDLAIDPRTRTIDVNPPAVR